MLRDAQESRGLGDVYKRQGHYNPSVKAIQRKLLGLRQKVMATYRRVYDSRHL